MNHQTHRQAQIAVYLAHPFAVAAGQVVVDRHHMHPFAGQGVQVSREDNGLGLAFTGLHFRNAALMQDDAANNLNGEVGRAQHPAGGFAADGKGVGQDIV